MKKFLFLLTAMAISAMATTAFADGNQVTMNEQHGNQGHNEGTLPPEVTYDDGEETLTVELDMTAPAGYVEVTDDATGATQTAAPLAGGENVVPMPTLETRNEGCIL